MMTLVSRITIPYVTNLTEWVEWKYRQELKALNWYRYINSTVNVQAVEPGVQLNLKHSQARIVLTHQGSFRTQPAVLLALMISLKLDTLTQCNIKVYL